MQYPNITSYIEVIENFSCFKTLRLKVVRDQNDSIVFMTGNMSVVFKVVDNNGLYYALKCYTRKQQHLQETFNAITDFFNDNEIQYLTPYEYLHDEIILFDLDNNICRYPVVLSRWIEGASLKEVIKKYCYLDHKASIRKLLSDFVELSIYLIEQAFSHGDIKPSNIIIADNDKMHLIDIDSMYCPGIPYTTTSNFGTPQYQHPLRDENLFDRHTDDYSLLMICVSLLALGLNPSLYDQFSNDERLILWPEGIFGDSCGAYTHLRKHHAQHKILQRGLDLLRTPSPRISGLRQYLYLLRYSVSTIPLPDYPDTPLPKRNDEGKFGFAHGDHFVIEPVFDDVLHFSEGFAAVSIDGLWSYINLSGNLLLPFVYHKALPYNDGLAIVRVGALWEIIDSMQNRIKRLSADDLSSFCCNLARIRRNNRFGFINKAGEIVIDTNLVRAKNFRHGKAIVSRQEGCYGIIDINGNDLIAPIYKSIVRIGEERYEAETADGAIILEGELLNKTQ